MLKLSSQAVKPRRIIVLVPNFPSRVQTFIAQELLSLERLGHELEVHPLRAYGNDLDDNSVAGLMGSPIHYPDKNPIRRLGQLLTGISRARRLPGYKAANRAMIGDLLASRRLTPLFNFASALTIAHRLDSDRDILFAQFLKHPASIARYAGLMSNTTWVCSAHARDIWLAPIRDLQNKVNSAQWIAACTTEGADHLRKHALEPDRIHAVYHGVDSHGFPPYARQLSRAVGSDAALPVKLLTVGRIVQKKGFGDLINALSLLPPSLNWTLRHIGPSHGASSLRKLVADLGLSARVTFAGYKPPAVLVDEYRQSDVFILPCLIDRDGDMDGLPNALAEAASQAMACITTNVSEIPRLFVHETHALIVSPRDPRALAGAIERAITDPSLRFRLGVAASAMIRDRFDHQDQVKHFSRLFQKLDDTAEQTDRRAGKQANVD